MNTSPQTSKTNNNGNAKQNEWQKREIGALWKRESKASGKKYLAGHFKFSELGTEVTVKVVVFPNATKKNDKSPDFVVYVSQEDGATAAKSATATASVKPAASKAVEPQEDSDNIL